MELYVVIAVSFLLGGLMGYFYRGSKSSDGPSRQELELSRHEVAVIIRVMEEAGIQFNRDYERNVTGVVHEVEATMVGEGVTNGQR